jgi:copper chaperone
MLFDIENVTGDCCAPAIQRAILLQDPTAQVTVQVADQRVRVEGLLTEQQALDALAKAGYPATAAAPHSGEGSECCGGCS